MSDYDTAVFSPSCFACCLIYFPLALIAGYVVMSLITGDWSCYAVYKEPTE